MSIKPSKFASFFLVVISFLAFTAISIGLINKNFADPIKEKETSLTGKELTSGVSSALKKSYSSNNIQDGKGLVIVFLISTCEACSQETQFILQAKQNGKLGSNIIGIMFENDDVIGEYVKKQDIKFPVLSDAEIGLIKELEIDSFPTNIVIKAGIIEKALLGFPNDGNKLLDFMKTEN
jgi:peroxiredoxin